MSCTATEDLNVLVIEDHLLDADLILKQLSSVGDGIGEIRQTDTGAEALRIVREWRADLVLLDHSSPGLGGLDLLRDLLTLGPGLMVILLTQDQEIAVVREALRLGAADTVVKSKVLRQMANRTLATIVAEARRRRRVGEIRRNLVSIVSHDLIAPLSHFLGSASLLFDGDRIQQGSLQAADLTRIVADAVRVQSLALSLLSSVRLGLGIFKLRRSLVDLPRLLADVLDRISCMAFAKEVSVLRSFPAFPLTVWLDPAIVEQVVTNLLSNAITFAPRGSEIHVTTSVDSCWASIRVCDQGPGLPEEVLSHLFQRPVQPTSSTATRNPGAGLGLFVVERFMKAHGGRVVVESRPGEGTTVSVSFPLDPSGIDDPDGRSALPRG